MNTKTNKYISAIGKIGGTKDSPLPYGPICLQEDNVMVEFNITPANNKKSFHEAVNGGLELSKQFVSNRLGPDLDLVIKASTLFDPHELVHERSHIFGCDPDYSAWTGKMNRTVKPPNKYLRSCGGHIHVGSDVAQRDPISVVRAMDLFLGVPSIIMDADTQRRTLYGKAGAFRPKPYGVEYRTLSNFWIAKAEYIDWVYDQTVRSLEFVVDEKVLDDDAKAAIQHCINTSDVNMFEELKREFNLATV